MIVNGLLTLLTLAGGIAMVIIFVIGMSLGVKWFDKKYGDMPTPKWLLKLDAIMEKVVGFIMGLILLGFFVAMFIGLYQTMWK